MIHQKGKQPVLIILQDMDDTIVNIGYSRDLMKLFDNTSVSHTLYEYPTGGQLG